MRKMGYTMIELIVIIVILGILAVIATPRLLNISGKAAESAATKAVDSVNEGIQNYNAQAIYNNATDLWPATLDSASVGQVTASNPIFGNVLKEAVKTGWIKLDSVTYKPILDYNTFYVYNPNNGTFTKGGTVGGGSSTGPATFYGVVADQTTGTGWSASSDAQFTSWSDGGISFNVDFASTGTYHIVMSAMNNPNAPGQGTYQPRDQCTGVVWHLPLGYTEFLVDVSVDSTPIGTLHITASDVTYNSASLDAVISTTGMHNLTFNWTNDLYNPGPEDPASPGAPYLPYPDIREDANIMIEKIVVSKL